ncbi:MAG: hypothetical protein ACRCXZ_04980 [Patescibacteria group bacterium]
MNNHSKNYRLITAGMYSSLATFIFSSGLVFLNFYQAVPLKHALQISNSPSQDLIEKYQKERQETYISCILMLGSLSMLGLARTKRFELNEE